MWEAPKSKDEQKYKKESGLLYSFCSDWYVLIGLDAHSNILSPFGKAANFEPIKLAKMTLF
jgi:hypothetical protein